jgi:hypothetical protein
MNEEQIIAAGQALEADPRPWSGLTEMERGILRALMPSPSFTAAQRSYLSQWWLACNEDDVDAINTALTNRRVFPRADIDGALFVGADLLSDALDDGPLSSCMSIIGELTLYRKLAADWPTPQPFPNL